MTSTKKACNFNWLHVRRVAERVPCAFCFFIGGRGTGKTFNALKDHRDDFVAGNAGGLMYTRITQKQLDTCADPADNPYFEINLKYDTKVTFESKGGKSDAYDIIDATDEDNPVTIGEGRSLASFHDLRGVNFTHIKEWYFDEFIPTENVRRTPEIKRAGYLFSQAYETVNRNRELFGEPPVKVIFTANAFSLDSSILAWFGLIDVIQTMQRKGQKRYTDRERSIYIELCESNEISEAKRKTVLYRACSNNQQFIKTNIENKFDDVALYATKRDIAWIEYEPLVNFDNQITIYRHKSTGALHIARKADKNAADCFTRDMRGRMLTKWGSVVRMGMFDRRITFDSADTYYMTDTIFDKSVKSL